VSEFRSGLVALAGRPNVGKSTLTNALVEGHVSIVSDRPQTTRRRSVGVVSSEDWQIVLLDLPGFQRPRDGLTERMQRSVDETLADVDAIVFVLDATEPSGAGDRFIARAISGRSAPILIALNKVDRLTPEAIGQAIGAVAELVAFEELHPVSALTGDGVDALRADLAARMPEGPALYPVTSRSGDPVRLHIAELIREQALQRTREEVPHAIAVTVDEVELGGRKEVARVMATLVVETSSQQRILVGKRGTMIRDIGTGARPGIEQALGKRVMLDLSVNVRKNWRNDPSLLDRLGP
jgi:GTP-binding protein Era